MNILGIVDKVWLSEGSVPCSEARDWISSLPTSMTPREAWESCPRGEWMLDLSARAGVNLELLVLATCDAVEPTLRFLPSDEDRPRRAIEKLKKWAKNDLSNPADELERAQGDTYDAYYGGHLGAEASIVVLAVQRIAQSISDKDGAFLMDAIDEARNSFYYRDGLSGESKYLAKAADLIRARIPWETVEAAIASKLSEAKR